MNDAIEIARFRLYLRVFLESIRSNIKLEKGVKVNLEVGNALIDESIYDKFHNYTLDNGFDCIVGNPPYVEYSKIRKQYEVDNMKTIKCGNIYAYIIEKSLNLLKDNGTIGVIAPISLVSTPRMYPLRRFIEQNCKTMFFQILLIDQVHYLMVYIKLLYLLVKKKVSIILKYIPHNIIIGIKKKEKIYLET